MPGTPAMTTRLAVRIPDPVHAELVAEAEEEGYSTVSHLVRELLREHTAGRARVRSARR